MACVVCARKDWLESRFTVYPWRTATGSSSYTELTHVDSGSSKLLTCGDHLCFGNRDLTDIVLNTKRYSEILPPSFQKSTSMLLLFCSPVMRECRGYSTPDVCPWCQTAAGLRRAVLNGLQPNLQAVLHSLYHNTSVQVSTTLTEWLISAMIARHVCASKTSSLRCLVSLSLIACGLAGSIHCFRPLPWVFAFFSDWVVFVLESFCWEQVAEKTKALFGNDTSPPPPPPSLSQAAEPDLSLIHI